MNGLKINDCFIGVWYFDSVDTACVNFIKRKFAYYSLLCGTVGVLIALIIVISTVKVTRCHTPPTHTYTQTNTHACTHTTHTHLFSLAVLYNKLDTIF